MAILSTEMGRGVPVNIFGVRVSACHKQSLDNSEVASNAGNMEGSPEVFGAGINNCPIFN